MDPAPLEGLDGYFFISNIRDILYKDAHKHCWYLWFVLYSIFKVHYCL